MIGVIAKAYQAQAAGEFFELFKTPWEPYRQGRHYDVVIATVDEIPEVRARLLLVFGPAVKSSDERAGIAAGVWAQSGVIRNQRLELPIYAGLLTLKHIGNGSSCLRWNDQAAGLRVNWFNSILIRLGYDLFAEVEWLLSKGQPVEQASIPTLDIHINMLREWILNAGISLVEIPPAPAGYSFAVCLTHDIDFIGIRAHRFDHSMWGFVYRATAGSLWRFVTRRISLKNLFKNWLAAASLPFVYAGWVKDFWEPFEWYLKVEQGLPVTYFLIPFKRRAGEQAPGPHAARRATAYDVSDLSHIIPKLLESGCEIGVHGIDAWHNADAGREELARVGSAAGHSSIGIRMHWLLRGENTPAALEEAGYTYDSTVGYNDAVGYRAGTGQVFRPLGVQNLLEVPLHIQDGALFYPRRMALSEHEAERRCRTLIENASKFGGVLTVLWHDRSHGPERFWGNFYIKLLRILESYDAWYGTASEVAAWFQKRREVRFEVSDEPGAPSQTRIRYDGDEIDPPLKVRFYRPPNDGEQREFTDVSWNGKPPCTLEWAADSPSSNAAPELTGCFSA